MLPLSDDSLAALRTWAERSQVGFDHIAQQLIEVGAVLNRNLEPVMADLAKICREVR